MNTEPVLTVAGLQAVIVAVFILIASFGDWITDAQRAAFIGLYAVVAPIAFALYARAHVTPVTSR